MSVKKTATAKYIEELAQALSIARAVGPEPRSVPEPEPRSVPVNVPSSLWAGKSFDVAFSNLQGEFADEVIAYILVEHMGCDKTKTGAFFYPDNGEIKDSKTYQTKTNTLISKAKQRYSFTFNESM